MGVVVVGGKRGEVLGVGRGGWGFGVEHDRGFVEVGGVGAGGEISVVFDTTQHDNIFLLLTPFVSISEPHRVTINTRRTRQLYPYLKLP